ncbi:bifunctional folylpolyglutamate synthase/dihydrofolate synthase [bacterium]|nr:bifunctional folylpolyglutamate synthase/dihydrofolate synthase [bacterium]
MTELENYLCSLRTFGVRPGLENTQKAISALKERFNIQKEPKFLHVAGTNGKGSTCAFLDSILKEAGLKHGLFTSPHLIDLRERIKIDGEMIGEKRFEELALEVKTMGDGLTFFEYLTVLAWLYFSLEACEYVVWETGLGGRLDATSAVEPYVTAITNIGLEHTQYLGDTIEKIAAEKAGIIRPKIPLFHTCEGEAKDVMEATCAKLDAPCKFVTYTEGYIQPLKYFISIPEIDLYNAELGLIGNYQYGNAAIAAKIANYCGIDTISILNGLKRAVWPGRLQILRKVPITILDCAHNAQGWQALVRSLLDISEGKWKIYFGMLKEKDPKLALEILEPIADSISYIEPQNERKLSCEEWKKLVPNDRRFEKVFKNSAGALTDIQAQTEGNILICGSCYMAGEILALIEGKTRDNSKDDPVGKN